MVDFPLQKLFPTNHLQPLRAPHEDVGAGSSTLLAAVDLLEGTWASLVPWLWDPPSATHENIH
jgi:hypothetical protein